MKRRAKFLVGGLVILVALAYLIYAGVTQSLVYFVTPTELLAAPAPGKSYRLGGMVQPGSLKWEPKSLDLRFVLSDGQAAVPVRHVGPPLSAGESTSVVSARYGSTESGSSRRAQRRLSRASEAVGAS